MGAIKIKIASRDKNRTFRSVLMAYIMAGDALPRRPSMSCNLVSTTEYNLEILPLST
jgi:hypothetical protein